MLKFFPYHVVDDYTLPSDDAVYQKVLPSRGVVTQLDIEFRATNGATSNIANPLFGCINRIEIVGDGTDKILSLPGDVLFKYLTVVNGKYPEGVYSEVGGTQQRLRLSIPFGRFYGDETYGLKLDRYSEVRVDVDYDLEAVRACGATGYVSGSGQIDMVAHMTLPGETIGVSGCRRCIDRKSFTTAASGEEDWIPVQDYPYTAIGVYCRESGVADGVDITDIELDMGAGKPKIFDYSWRELEEIMKMVYPGDYEFRQTCLIADSDTKSTYTGVVNDYNLELEQSVTIGTDDTSHIHVESIAGDVMTFQVYTIEGTGTWSANAAQSTVQTVNLSARGEHVGNLIMLPMARPDTFENQTPAAEFETATLRMTQGGAGGAAYVITEQILSQ